MFIFILTLLICLGFCVLVLYVATAWPAWASYLANIWRRTIGWVVLLLGILVFSLGMQGFAIKQNEASGSFLIAIYETLQLFFLNASDEAAISGVDQKVEVIDQKLTSTSSNGQPIKSQTNVVTKRLLEPNDGKEASDAQVKSPEPKKLQINGWILSAEICAAIFVALLAIEAIWLLLHRSFETVRLAFTVDHIVVCGYGRLGRAIVKSYLEGFARNHNPNSRRRQVVIIDNSMTKADLEWAKRHGVVVIQGDSRDREILQESQVLWAQRIFVVTGGDEVNLEVMSELQSLTRENKRNPLEAIRNWRDRNRNISTEAYIHLSDQDTIEVARRRLRPTIESLNGDGIRFLMFSSFDRTARLLLRELVRHPRFKKLNEVDSSSNLHLVLVGFGEVGQGMALRLAELCQFKNAKRIRMTILDREIDKRKACFLSKHPNFCYQAVSPRSNSAMSTNNLKEPWFDKKLSVEWGKEPNRHEGSIWTACNAKFVEYVGETDSRFVNELGKLSDSNDAIAVIFCGDLGKENFLSGENLCARLRQSSFDCPVFSWMGDSQGLTGIAIEKVNYSEPIPFGLCMKAISYDEVVDDWVEYLAKWLQFGYSQKYGDESCKEWQILQGLFERIASPGCGVILRDEERTAFAVIQKSIEESWQSMARDPVTCEDFRHSNLSAAAHAIVKLASVGMSIEGHRHELEVPRLCSESKRRLLTLKTSVDAAAMEHNRWVVERLIRGWTYTTGQKKTVAKEHPDLISWKAMLEKEKANSNADKETEKDIIAISLVVSLCLTGLLIVECESCSNGCIHADSNP